MLPGVIDATAVRFLFFTLAAWLHHREADAIAYLLEENRTLRAQLGRRPLRFSDAQRRRLAVLGHGWVVLACAPWRDSSRLTRFSAGIASW